MKRLMLLWLVVTVSFVLAAQPVHKQKVTRVLGRTYAGTIVDTSAIHSATFGRAAEAFIPDCEVWLHGKKVDPVPSPYGSGEMGVFISKTSTEVTVNGRVVNSINDKPGRLVKPADPAIIEGVRIRNEALCQIRLKATRNDSIADAYVVQGRTYKPDVPTPYTLEGGDTTVMVTVEPKSMGGLDYVCIEYQGRRVSYPLHPGPKPSEAEQLEQRLDVVYGGWVRDCAPGRIVIHGSGATYSFPARMRSELMDALKKIPDLAEPTKEDGYGHMMYKFLKINGITFDSGTVRDFVQASREVGR